MTIPVMNKLHPQINLIPANAQQTEGGGGVRKEVANKILRLVSDVGLSRCLPNKIFPIHLVFAAEASNKTARGLAVYNTARDGACSFMLRNCSVHERTQ